jgi:hypothetical protein
MQRRRVATAIGAGLLALAIALVGLMLPEPSYGQTGPVRPTDTPGAPAGNTPIPTVVVGAATNTPVPTATNTPAPGATNTPVPPATNTPVPGATNTPVPTATNTSVAQPPAPAPGATDFAIAGGWFYTQTGGGGGRGYAVTDAGGVRFWSEFQRLGGVQAVGYPASQRFQWDGFTVQVFQRVIFQWRPEVGQVYFVNVFDRLHDLGKDAQLLNVRQTPPPRAFADGGLAWDAVVANHLAVLDQFPAIKAAYFAVVGDPIQANGLPVSDVTDMGNHLAVRAQRVVYQQWKQDVPWARAGQVTVALGGDITKEMGVLPDPNALQPTSPP